MNKQQTAFDYFGQEIKVGDIVAYSSCSNSVIYEGKVEKITAKKVVLQRESYPYLIIRYHHSVIKKP